LTENGLDEFNGFAELCGRYAAFISVSDVHQQAYVFRASGESVGGAWDNAAAAASEFIAAEEFSPVWVKGDITFKGERAALSDVIEAVGSGYGKFFRRGISFDENLDAAFIEAELNSFSLISYKKKTIELVKLNKYLAGCELKTLTQMPENVILFDCKSAFCDEKSEVYSLYPEGNNCGRRINGKFDKDTALRVISTSAEYLSMQIGLDGKFDYGFYPTVPKVIPGFNILRHASSIWSLLCSYRITGDKFILTQAESAIGYLVNNTVYKYPKRGDKENAVYVVEKTKNEVKLGANAVAVIVLTEYMDITGSGKYRQLAVELGNGILELFDERDGSFFHVLKYPSLAPRDKFRTVYYDGESVFALCRLYGLTKETRFLDTARAAVDHFIKDNYTQYADHWVAYSLNELTKYDARAKYLNFALKNVQVNMEKIYKQPTTYHTYLELLCVAFETYTRIKEQRLECPYLDKFDEKRFVETIFHRADYMLNGYGYPEYVMYFAQPSEQLGSFFVRHDSYRTRIDDVQHFCSAYYSLYRNYEKLDKLRE
ncbi:MAG: glycosyl hydrolase family 88, partial [Ruminococcus sp.]|nr:glycosyl hydrolase family 88 [Ruminococcus sp.]